MLNIKLRYKIASGLLIVGGIFLWGRCSRATPSTSPNVLPKDVKEQIIIDPYKHKLTIVTHDSYRVVFLPNRPSVINIKTDNTVKVTSPQFGFEARPFVGIGFSDDIRSMIGVNWLYWKRLDLGTALQLKLGLSHPRAALSLSYNFWSNMQVSLTYDNTKFYGTFVSVRL